MQTRNILSCIASSLVCTCVCVHEMTQAHMLLTTDIYYICACKVTHRESVIFFYIIDYLYMGICFILHDD